MVEIEVVMPEPCEVTRRLLGLEFELGLDGTSS